MNKEIINYECRNCWFQEGGRCYVDEDHPRDEKGFSTIFAVKKCSKFLSKRDILSRYIPNEKLIIMSELLDSNANKNN